MDVVTNYIIRQKEHHKIITFKDEVEKFMKEYNVVEYDAKYFWD